ncbi:MAG: glycosyltransferase [Gaiellaceae bacterium]
MAGLSVAAVIPTHNRADLLGRAIESALSQSSPPDEVIVVDDGSTDDISSVVRRYGGSVRLTRKPRGGVGSARNLGVAISEADFVAFLDSDDYWDDSYIDSINRAIAATDRAALLYFCDLRLSEQRGGQTIWERCGFSISGPHEFRRDALDWLLMPRQPLMIPASVIRRDAYLDVGGSSERLPRRSDTHLFFKIGLSGPLCAVAGIAGEATSDDRDSLSYAVTADDPAYLDCTTWLYSDLLGRMSGRSRHERSAVSKRLAGAHWSLVRRGAIGPASRVLHLAFAVRNEPGIIPRRLGRLIGRRLHAFASSRRKPNGRRGGAAV